MIENLDHEHCYCKIPINENTESLTDIGSAATFHVIPHLRICLVSKICNPKSIFTVLLQPFVDTCRAKKNLSCPTHVSTAGAEQGDAPPSVSALKCKQVSFSRSKWATFFTFSCLLQVTLLFKVASKHNAEVPSFVLKQENCDVPCKKKCVRWASFRHGFQRSWPWVQC